MADPMKHELVRKADVLEVVERALGGQWRIEDRNGVTILQNLENAIRALPPAEDVGRLADIRQIRMAVAAWLEGRWDGDRTMTYIHDAMGGPTADALKQSCIRHQQEPR